MTLSGPKLSLHSADTPSPIILIPHSDDHSSSLDMIRTNIYPCAVFVTAFTHLRQCTISGSLCALVL